MSAGGDRTTRTAISDAAARLGHGDPVAAADDLVAVDVGALRTWCSLTGQRRQAIASGTDRLIDALPLLRTGWSSAPPRAAIERQRSAGLAARDVLGRQIDAAQDVVGVLESARTSAEASLARTVDRIRGTGWPPAEDLLIWATGHGRLPEVADAVGGLAETVRHLRSRNDESLLGLAQALRADPAEPVDQVIASTPPAIPLPGLTAPPGPPQSDPARIDQPNLDRLEADLHSGDLIARAAAQGVKAALDQAGPDAQLLVYESADLTSQGRAAIAVGDITTADNVVAMAPGVSSAPVTMADGIAGVTALQRRASEIAPGERTAVVAWYGYDIPLAVAGGTPMTPESTLANLGATTNDLYARAGGQQLVDDLVAFRNWAPDDARFIGMGFSMGSTTVSAAAARGAGFDDLVLMGSPGAGIDVDSAADYPGMSADHVWVVAHDQDPITTGVTDGLAGIVSGAFGMNFLQPTPFGPDPAGANFGAHVLDVPSNAPDIDIDLGGPFGGLVSAMANTAIDLRAHHQEGNYMSGRSLDALASIVVGNYDDVPLRPGR